MYRIALKNLKIKNFKQQLKKLIVLRYKRFDIGFYY